MIGWVIAAPLLGATISIAFRGRDTRRAIRVLLAGVSALLPLTLIGTIDGLSTAFAVIVSALGFLATAFSAGAFSFDWGIVDTFWSRKSVFFMLLGTFWSAMLLVVLADNFALLWLGVSATTLATAFLVGYSGEPAALEAAWKYLILCSIGIAFALLGIIVLARVSVEAGVDPANALSWRAIVVHHPLLSAPLARLAVTLMTIGFATKAGLVPMHAWLPDAHSKAPAPISALLSGVLVSCALYAIMRTLAVGTALGAGPQLHLLLTCLGALSTVVAGALMLAQTDLKRLLAYSTVEHAGIVALALGFGGPLGLFAALFHVFAHAFSKSGAFLAAGLVQLERGTTRLGELHGLWEEGSSGKMLLAALTALSGMPPFGIFLGELLLVLAGVAAHSWLALGAGLVGLSFAFAALSRTAIQIESGHPGSTKAEAPAATGQDVHRPARILSRIAIAATAVALVGAIGVAIVPWTGLGEPLRLTSLHIGGSP
jgi:hydrogenase-4 component F